MAQKKNEAKVKALGSPWSGLMKSLRSARDTHIKLIDKENVAASIKKSWRKSHKKDYDNDLKLILRLARKAGKSAREAS
jgi:DNA transposition AAA+ family ATPase